VFAIETVFDGAGRERFFNVKNHLDLLEAALAEQRIDLLIIDPLTTVMAGSDRNAEGDTRDSLTPLIKLAERANVAVMGVAHVGKPTGTTRTPAQRILGATAFHALARVVWMTAPVDDGTMALGVVKSNFAMKPDALTWSREEDGPFVWHGVATRGIGDLLNGMTAELPRDFAEGFLRDLLREGARPSYEVEAAAKAEGNSARTLRRAGDDIGAKMWKERGGLGRWFWMLPDGEPCIAEPDADLAEINLSTP
jgi:putative DNA primase/helicase